MPRDCRYRKKTRYAYVAENTKYFIFTIPKILHCHFILRKLFSNQVEKFHQLISRSKLCLSQNRR